MSICMFNILVGPFYVIFVMFNKNFEDERNFIMCSLFLTGARFHPIEHKGILSMLIFVSMIFRF